MQKIIQIFVKTIETIGWAILIVLPILIMIAQYFNPYGAKW